MVSRFLELCGNFRDSRQQIRMRNRGFHNEKHQPPEREAALQKPIWKLSKQHDADFAWPCSGLQMTFWKHF
jgi:hypothetical protein